MAHVNPHTHEVSANIVYYGPCGSGKTACLEYIHRKLRTDLRGKLTRVPAQLDPTASYELLPVELGEIKGMRTRFQIASVPGDPIHTPTRKALLRDVDGIVFVADSRADYLASNLESLKDLEENLAAYGRRLSDVPIVFQWNRSEQPGAMMPEALSRKLNPHGAEAFESVASEGSGVLPALTTITKLILRNLRSGSHATTLEPPSAAAPRRSAGSAPATFRVAEPPAVAHFAEAPRGEQFDPRSISREADLGVGTPRDPRAAQPPAAAEATIVIEETGSDAFADDLLDARVEPIEEEELPEASLADLTADLLEEPEGAAGPSMERVIADEAEESPAFEAARGIDTVTDLETIDLDADFDAMSNLETAADLEPAADLGALDLPMEPFEESAERSASIDALESAADDFDFAGEVARLAGGPDESGFEEIEPEAAPPPGETWEIVGVGAPTRMGPSTFTIPLEISEGGGEAHVAEITITLSPPKPARKGP